MAQIFAYITHKDGAAEDSALELVVAAKKIDAGAQVTAIVTGSGADLDKVAGDMTAAYGEVWKVDNEALAYPNAEVIRKLLVNILPAGAMVLLPHDTFGMDLGPGLAVKLDASFAPDVVGIDGVDGSTLKVVRQEYGGQVSTHVDLDISTGAVINVRGGCFLAEDAQAGGQVVDKSGDAGDLTAKRRFLEVVEAEAGDVDITKSEVLVSVGRGIEDEDNLEIAFDLAKAMGADVSCSRPIVDAKWMEKSRQVGHLGSDRQAQGLSGLRHQRVLPAHGRHQGQPLYRGHQQEHQGPDFPVGRCGY